MILPKTFSEQLLFNTIQIRTDEGSGTGSFFQFNIDNKFYPVIITNQHVINYQQEKKVKLLFHVTDENNNPTDENILIETILKWHFHPKYDLCFAFIAPLLNKIKTDYDKQVFYIVNTLDMIPNKESLDNLTALEEVVMVGYPIGLYDHANNLPILRKGYTASHPAIDFDNKKTGLVDMACFPGSSGSPIYIYNRGGYTDRNGNTFLGNSRFLLIGYQVSVPVYNAKGEITIEATPTSKISTNTQIMTNLGFYIKSSVLYDFLDIIKAIEKST